MAIKIRLRRMGRKKQAHYRIVVADTDSPRDGRFVESLGYYKPLSHPARVVVDMERVEYWLGQGAQTSETVNSLLRKVRAGGDSAVAVGEVDQEARREAEKEKLAARRKAEAEALAAEEEAAVADAKAEEKAPEPEAAPEKVEAEEAEAEAPSETPEEAPETPEEEAAAPEAEAQEEPAAEASDEEEEKSD